MEFVSHSILFSRHFNTSISYSIHSHLISSLTPFLFYSIPFLFSDRCWSIKGPNMISFKNSVHHDPVWSSMGGSPSCKNDIFGYFAWWLPCQRECVSSIKGKPVSHPCCFISYQVVHPSCSSIHLVQSSIHPILSSLLFMMNVPWSIFNVQWSIVNGQ